MSSLFQSLYGGGTGGVPQVGYTVEQYGQDLRNLQSGMFGNPNEGAGAILPFVSNAPPTSNFAAGSNLVGDTITQLGDTFIQTPVDAINKALGTKNSVPWILLVVGFIVCVFGACFLCRKG